MSKLSLKLYKNPVPLFHGLAVSTHIGIFNLRTRRDAKQSDPKIRTNKTIASRTRAERGNDKWLKYRIPLSQAPFYWSA
jgi:hypothetical protein